ncbi:unnamed protein product [Prorocentrum cordatum]|uniref:Calmodulin-lysine N-methyltransferase n=1 Tax=Prorocentrum cordatum TaxID=2364126 RepID=A0ABN9V1S3_9DINO|nr:unnamed protein product [Polarella glacialis]
MPDLTRAPRSRARSRSSLQPPPACSRSVRASAGAGAGAELRVRCLDWLEAAGRQGAAGVDFGSPENVGAGHHWERLGDDERHSFDLVMASDVLYEARDPAKGGCALVCVCVCVGEFDRLLH